MMRTSSECFFLHPLFPLLPILLGMILEYSGLDLWWVSRFYDFPGKTWPYKHHWFFDSVIHGGGQWCIKIMALSWCIAFAMTFFRHGMKSRRKILVCFLVATAAGPLLVTIGKHITHIHTPWDLRIFHGTQPYLRLLDPVPAGVPIGHAFPAGHSSSGFAFMSLYFLLHHLHRPYRIHGLLFGFGLGLVFGLGQQIRGAHFPSHDLFSLAVCWSVAVIVYFSFYPEQRRRAQTC